MPDTPLALPLDDSGGEVVTLIAPGKLRCVITDKLRPDTPEEHVRQRIARSLLVEYDYRRENMEVEFTISIGSRKTRIDIAIFPPNTPHKQENVYIIVECKREEIKPTDRDNGVEQLKSYISACLNARYGMWIGSELSIFERDRKTNELEEAADIPRAGSDAPQPLTFAQLVPAQDELIGVFKRCHNYIYGNQGMQKEPAFQELLKLIFCKVLDEDTSSGVMRFFISNEERRSDIGQKKLRNTINQLFEAVKQKFPYIFDKSDQLHLQNRVLAYIVGEMQRYSLLQTNTDVKGAAYEQLVGSNLRGDRGEFFTPRTVCDMTAYMLLATYPRERRTSLRTLDPACGTGGFLVSIIAIWAQIIYEQEIAKWGENQHIKAADDTRRRVKETANALLIGMDFNPVLVRAAQMNLVMHGDGSTNVFHVNSLLPPGEWPSEPPNDPRNHVRYGDFDIILTNPPFGANIPIDDPHILDQFQLAKVEVPADRSRQSLPPEQIFIERCIQLLKPGGRLGIVLPDSILSNSGLGYIRRWLLQECQLVASIDLPQVTFEPYTGVQTSVLILRKKTANDRLIENRTGKPIPYQVFMATPQQVGHDRRGETLYLRTSDGELIEYEEEQFVEHQTSLGNVAVETRREKRTIKHDELPEVVKLFEEWLGQEDRMRWLNADADEG